MLNRGVRVEFPPAASPRRRREMWGQASVQHGYMVTSPGPAARLLRRRCHCCLCPPLWCVAEWVWWRARAYALGVGVCLCFFALFTPACVRESVCA